MTELQGWCICALLMIVIFELAFIAGNQR